MSSTYNIRKMTSLPLTFCKHKVIHIFYKIKFVDYIIKIGYSYSLKLALYIFILPFMLVFLLKTNLDLSRRARRQTMGLPPKWWWKEVLGLIIKIMIIKFRSCHIVLWLLWKLMVCESLSKRLIVQVEDTPPLVHLT